MDQPHQNSGQAQAIRDQGIAALRAGDKQRARDLLQQATRQNPGDEYAWLWLAGALDSDQERRYCLQQVLAINPANANAQRGLERLGAAPATPPTTPQASAQPPQAGAVDYPPVDTSPVPGAQTPQGGDQQIDYPPLGSHQQTDYPPTSSYQQTGAAAQGSYQQTGDPQQGGGQQLNYPPGGYPQAGYPAPPGFHVPTAHAKRPGCITILAILTLIAGTLLVLASIFLAIGSNNPEFRRGLLEGLPVPGTVLQLIIGLAVIIGLLYIATGVGLWRGARWAWWILATSSAFEIASRILSIVVMASQGTLGNDSAALGRALGSLVIPLIIMVFLFKANTWNFFRMHHVSKNTATGIVFGVGFLLAAGAMSVLLM